MSGEKRKVRSRKRKPSKLLHWLNTEGRRYCAVALCASLIAGNLSYVAIAGDEEPEYCFEMDRQELCDAVQKAIASGEPFEETLTFQGEAAESYDEIMSETLYELTSYIYDEDEATPSDSQQNEKLELRIFACPSDELINDLATDSNASDEIVSEDESDGTEHIYFMLVNKSDKEQTAVIRVGEKETEVITVAPYNKVEIENSVPATSYQDDSEDEVIVIEDKQEETEAEDSLEAEIEIEDESEADEEEAEVDENEAEAEEAEEVAAVISYHEVYRVASEVPSEEIATPSEAEEVIVEEEKATASNATDSNSELSVLDGELLEAVQLGKYSAVIFATTFADLEITVSGHLLECEKGCSGQDCECSCHAVQQELIADIEELLNEVRGYNETTEWDTMRAACMQLFETLPDAIESAYENRTLTDAEYDYLNEVFETYGTEMLTIMTELGFDPYGINTLETKKASVNVDIGSSTTHSLSSNGNGHGSGGKESISNVTITPDSMSDGKVTVTKSSGGNDLTITASDTAVTGSSYTFTVTYTVTKENGGGDRWDYGSGSSSTTTTNYTLELTVKVTQSVKNQFYWRFDQRTHGTAAYNAVTVNTSGSAEAELNELATHVRVSYKPKSGTEDKKLAYGGISSNKSTLTLEDGGVATNKTNVGDEIYIETDIGYVITSYMIGCEFGSQYAEGCQTAATNNLKVELSSDGKYQSKLTIDKDTYVGESGTGSFFGHSSERNSNNHHYALILSVVKVNVDLTVDKKANRESVSSGENIVYTVTANTTNDLQKVQFTDEFLKSATVNSVKLIDDNDNETILEKTNSNWGWSYKTDPTKYYVDTSKGIVYVDGLWTKDYKIELTYTYTYKGSSNSTETVLTNTVWGQGTLTDTTATVNDYGVASVDVIINNPNYATLRVYKVFEGLTYDDVYGALNDDGERSGGVLEDFYMTAFVGSDEYVLNLNGTGSDSGKTYLPLKYSNDYSNGTDTFAFYGDIYNVDPKWNVSVTEFNYYEGTSLKDSYTSCDVISRWSIDDGSKTETSGDSDSVENVTLTKGKTTVVTFNNSYSSSTSITISKTVTGNMADVNKEFTFQAYLTKSDESVDFPEAVSGDTYTVSTTAEGQSVATFTLKHDGSITIDDIPYGVKVVVKEIEPTGYTPSYQINSGGDELDPISGKMSETLTATVDSIAGEVIFAFTNEKEVKIDAGILLDSMPYVVILAAVVAGGTFYFVRKKKEDEDDLE